MRAFIFQRRGARPDEEVVTHHPSSFCADSFLQFSTWRIQLIKLHFPFLVVCALAVTQLTSSLSLILYRWLPKQYDSRYSGPDLCCVVAPWLGLGAGATWFGFRTHHVLGLSNYMWLCRVRDDVTSLCYVKITPGWPSCLFDPTSIWCFVALHTSSTHFLLRRRNNYSSI